MRTPDFRKAMFEICRNAKNNGMEDDPGITYNYEPDLQEKDCGFSMREELINENFVFPTVCGNCKWYSVTD